MMTLNELKVLRKLQSQFQELSVIISEYEDIVTEMPDSVAYKVQLISLYNHREEMEGRIILAKKAVRKLFRRMKRSVAIKQISKSSRYYQ